MGGAKTCGRCGADVTGRSRSKMSDGSYVCRRCMKGDRRSARGKEMIRRNAIWAAVVVVVAGLLFLTVWATARPPGGKRR